MHTLVGDIGGTKTVLAFAQTLDRRLRLTRERRYSSGSFDSLESMILRFFDETDTKSELGAFAVAGPVQADRSRITNLPWEIDARRLELVCGLRSACLLNDLESVAWGIPALGPEDLSVLHSGEEGVTGNACVVAAGTGLGEAGLYWDGMAHHPFASEGGHADFAPSDDRETDLQRYLSGRYGHVSWERVVSGMGIGNIYAFLADRAGADRVPDRASADKDLAASVAGAAADGSCALCAETMELFFRLYGRKAGNTALQHMALGGVYLGGGIAPKNLALLSGTGFLQAFFDKGRMAPLMRRMPIKVILEQRAPLLGAARFSTERRRRGT